MHSMIPPTAFENHMQRGSALHHEGQPEAALCEFQSALALQPLNPETASACATVLLELCLPQAAYQCLTGVQNALLQHADGAANLGVAAEACALVEAARTYYQRALQLNPDHVRALNNTALMAAREQDWQRASMLLQRCVTLEPTQSWLWVNWIDLLTGGRNFVAALQATGRALERFPTLPALQVRQAVLNAFEGNLELSCQQLSVIGQHAPELLDDFLRQTSRASDRPVLPAPIATPNAQELFCKQAFEALRQCNWQYNERLTTVIRQMLQDLPVNTSNRDWRDVQLYGSMLELHEDEMAVVREVTCNTIRQQLQQSLPPFRPPAPRTDGRIRIGLATQDLHDARVRNALERQLALHDHTRFVFYLYSQTPHPNQALSAPLSALAHSVTEIGHLSNAEAAARMRLDQLDLFMDMAFNTMACRPELPSLRVAPVQIRQLTWHRHHPRLPCEYNVSDVFVHQDIKRIAHYGPVARLPVTCWLDTNDDVPQGSPAQRSDAGLPQEALVLCCWVPALMIDPATFGAWMSMLHAMPHALLWLPGYTATTRSNLIAQTQRANVPAARLVFAQHVDRAETLRRMRLADLFVDTLRFNANYGLIDALRMGVPALTGAGETMASRLSASVLQSASMADCVLPDAACYTDAAIALGRDPNALLALRERLAQAQHNAPLFDAPARVREWEAMWNHMVQRERQGLAPAAFDVRI